MTAKRRIEPHIDRGGTCANPVCSEAVKFKAVSWIESKRRLFHSPDCWRFFPPKIRAAVSLLYEHDMINVQNDLEGFLQVVLELSTKYPAKVLPGILGMKAYTFKSALTMYGLEYNKAGKLERKIPDLETAFNRCCRKWADERRTRKRKSEKS